MIEALCIALGVVAVVCGIGWVATWLVSGWRVNDLRATVNRLDSERRQLKGRIDELSAREVMRRATDDQLVDRLRKSLRPSPGDDPGKL